MTAAAAAAAVRVQTPAVQPPSWSSSLYRRTHLGLKGGRSAPRGRADLGGLAEHLLLLQGHAVLARGVAVLLVVEDGVRVVDQQLVLLGRREQLPGTTEEQVQRHGAVTTRAGNSCGSG